MVSHVLNCGMVTPTNRSTETVRDRQLVLAGSHPAYWQPSGVLLSSTQAGTLVTHCFFDVEILCVEERVPFMQASSHLPFSLLSVPRSVPDAKVDIYKKRRSFTMSTIPFSRGWKGTNPGHQR
jgi:hypothetical protein